jgi:hypothetical protein
MAGVAIKIGKKEAQQIKEYTGYPPEVLSDNDLQAAMKDLNIESEPLNEDDHQEIAAVQTGSKPTP